MKGLKGVIVISTIIAGVAALSACDKIYKQSRAAAGARVSMNADR